MLRKLLKILMYTGCVLLIFITGLFLYVLAVSGITPPLVENKDCLGWERTQVDSSLWVVKENWLHKSESGLYEMYVEGAPFERGAAIGKLTRELARYQEEVFVKQIRQIVPSPLKLTFLKYFVGWFNRNLDDNVPEEYKKEIYGISTESAPEFDFIASPYQRILNYHAAHDIGHALQNMSLVGCTSFAAWGDHTEDGNLIVARNFDFYVGDDFARNKIVAFYNPSEGHKFMMVTFGGMAGALSGMNDQGLTVTINAAKSEAPLSSAMPVSLVAREILQYASTIQQAHEVAMRCKMFVSESFLIGSAKDGKAAIIEKTPEITELVEPNSDIVICTNHFQGAKLGATTLNQEHVRTSASMYRWQRVAELVNDGGKISVQRSAAILRDQMGQNDKPIGLGNEKVINQLVAHHAIIFQPARGKVWISTSPWQLGKFVEYDLNKIMALKMIDSREITDSVNIIGPDPFLLTKDYEDFKKFAVYRFPFNPRHNLPGDSLVKWNPDSYLSYMLAGDASFNRKEFKAAQQFYQAGLSKEIATLQEREYMEDRLRECKSKLP